MNKLLATATFGIALLGEPVEMGSFEHQKTIEDITSKTRNILELKQKQDHEKKQKDHEDKIRLIRDAIDGSIDPKETRVLLIWVSEYKYLSWIGWAVPDTREMRRLFRTRYGIPSKHIYSVKDKQATKRNILGMINKVALETPDDKKIIIYYSWHWIALDSKWREAKKYAWDYEWYISTYYSDYKYVRVAWKNKPSRKIRIYYKDQRISKTEIDEAVWNKQKNLIIVDACYAWALTKNISWNSTIVAASNNEVALWYSRSLFSWIIMDVISSGRKNTLWEAVTWSGEEMTDKIREWKSPQNPLVETKDFKYDIKKEKFTKK
ncbi:MAG: hypothetical protein ACD_2C00263G0008 [uncultured bacterium (gcode 4)]|uniref:Uncharacterized protein n=1 Tax=uncultured bacterium (gcode 4) TaxID=1234023 RepID=K2G3N8_9BACT|nr:MAG: hypothetical protein ACD_2C00263G0008 [uncultured bacterium (gcode 4)]